jgi:hypothetical protein
MVRPMSGKKRNQERMKLMLCVLEKSERWKNIVPATNNTVIASI